MESQRARVSKKISLAASKVSSDSNVLQTPTAWVSGLDIEKATAFAKLSLTHLVLHLPSSTPALTSEADKEDEDPETVNAAMHVRKRFAANTNELTTLCRLCRANGGGSPLSFPRTTGSGSQPS